MDNGCFIRPGRGFFTLKEEERTALKAILSIKTTTTGFLMGCFGSDTKLGIFLYIHTY